MFIRDNALTVLLWIAIGVACLAGYATLLTASVFKELGVAVPGMLSQSTGWYLAAASLLALFATVALCQSPWLQVAGLVFLVVYFLSVAAVLFELVDTIMSVTWSLR